MSTVLVVDDWEPQREYLTTLFRHAGHRVLEAENGAEAITKLRNVRPDVVFTDVVMPTMDGFEFIRQMREQKETRDIPVVFYTGSYDEKNTQELAAAGLGATILPKPSEPNVVLRTLETVLRQPPSRPRALGEDFRSAHLELVTTQLHKKVSELERINAQLLTTNRALEKSNDSLRQFAYAAAHDLQEPMRNVLHATELLGLRCGMQIDSTGAMYMKESMNSARRMYAMIKSLLAYMTALDTTEAASEPVDSNEAAQEALNNLSANIAESQAQVRVENLPVLSVRKSHLVQVLQNLIENALKYRRDDVPPVIRISAVGDGNFWKFKVADNGIGFSPEYRERIFRIFKRLHGRDEYSGTGIGLAICARIVTHYGGDIRADGCPGEGATFSFTLPGRSTRGEAEDIAGGPPSNLLVRARAGQLR